MMRVIVLGVQGISAFHAFLGLVSLCVGVVSSIQAEVWLAHSVSPIWSGGFFLITGILGFLCSKKKTAYLIMCLTAFSVVSLVTAVVSIQLLRLGLVNHTTDGHTFQKEHKDVLIIIALVAAGTECIVCLISTIFSCRMAKAVKKELFKQRDGMFHVKEDVEDQNYTAESSIAFDNLSVEARQLGIEGQEYALGSHVHDVTGSSHYQEESPQAVAEVISETMENIDDVEIGDDFRQEPKPENSYENEDIHYATGDMYLPSADNVTSVHLDDINLGVSERKNSEVHSLTPRQSVSRQASQGSIDVPEVDT
ncbi:transmembrane protein 196-like [Liolophura sinensis]|uniref:transmembrane protein 196-like n=1 Tax=Liolophura sinensis TaxID=3198878 RepID=UPI003159546B